QTIGDAHCEAETLWLMGRARLGLGELAESQALLDDALDRVRRIRDRDDEFRVQTDRAATLRARGALGESLAAADEAVRLADALGSIDGLAAARIERALTLLALGRRVDAAPDAAQAVALADASGSGLRWLAHWALARILLSSGSRDDHASGLAHLHQAVSLAHGIRAQLDPDNQERWRLASAALGGPERDLEQARRLEF
ncbi:MAG: hypothetical protein AB7I13_11975, partial [Vicinamibacterales bacterium]